MLQKTLIASILIFVLCLPLESFGQAEVTGYRTADRSGSSRIVIDLSEKPVYKIFSLKDPDRVVIDIANAKWGNFNEAHEAAKRIKEVRYAKKDSNNLRIVVDFNESIYGIKDFTLNPDKNFPNRLVVDIEADKSSYQLSDTPDPVAKGGQSIGVPTPELKINRKPIIVIDAGHGGNDPGSTGRRGTQEKSVTIEYARELKDQLLATGKYKVYLTRSDDRYIDLRKRVDIARRKRGDLFISLHADSHKNKNIQGLSIYTLSERASDKEAAALAQKENMSDVIGGIKVEDNELSELLIDLVQRETKNISADFAETSIKELEEVARTLHNPHRFAGFRVLTGADIPSVLIELGYLSNRKEEKLLNSKKHKKELASAIVRAIDNHFNKYKID